MTSISDRCCMGYPLGDAFRCLNTVDEPDDLWCADCVRDLAGGERCGCENCAREFNEATS